MHIAVIGTGYVGLVTGACFAEFGVDVTCVDIDSERSRACRPGEMPIYEPGLEQLVTKNAQSGRLRFTTGFEASGGTSAGDFSGLLVHHRKRRLAGSVAIVETAARSVAEHMNGYKVIRNRSPPCLSELVSISAR